MTAIRGDAVTAGVATYSQCKYRQTFCNSKLDTMYSTVRPDFALSSSQYFARRGDSWPRSGSPASNGSKLSRSGPSSTASHDPVGVPSSPTKTTSGSWTHSTNMTKTTSCSVSLTPPAAASTPLTVALIRYNFSHRYLVGVNAAAEFFSSSARRNSSCPPTPACAEILVGEGNDSDRNDETKDDLIGKSGTASITRTATPLANKRASVIDNTNEFYEPLQAEGNGRAGGFRRLRRRVHSNVEGSVS